MNHELAGWFLIDGTYCSFGTCLHNLVIATGWVCRDLQVQKGGGGARQQALTGSGGHMIQTLRVRLFSLVCSPLPPKYVHRPNNTVIELAGK